MPEARIVRARGSHLYPGAWVTVEGGMPGAPGPCLVEFADGSAATGRLAPDGAGGAVLETDSYSTAAGTAVSARQWHLVAGADGACRVTRPAAGGKAVEQRRPMPM